MMSLQKAMANKFKHFVNSPFNIEFQGIKVELNKEGRMKIRQDISDGSFQEIECSPALINRIIRVIQMTRKVEWRDYPYRDEDEE